MSKILIENIKVYFPEIEDLPHADTLSRLLERIDPQEIEEIIINLLKRLIANKKLDQYKENGKYIIAFDGTGKFTREWEWSESCLKRHVKGCLMIHISIIHMFLKHPLFFQTELPYHL